MCPLRFILVFFSAVLAGYFAWRTVRSSPEIDGFVLDDSTAEKTSLREKQELNFKRVCFHLELMNSLTLCLFQISFLVFFFFFFVALLIIPRYWIFFPGHSKWVLGIRRYG